jgi:hypothetical protein
MELGVAKDFITAGKVTLAIVGLNGELLASVETTKRQLIEEVVVASGVPPSLFGYSWSSTERMSSVQARKLTGKVWAVRRAVEPCCRHLIDYRQRLKGDPRPYTLEWPDTSLTDLVETAKAALDDARAKNEQRKYWFELWRAGIADQGKVAEELTGSPEVVRPMEEPPAAAPEPVGEEPAQDGQEPMGEGRPGALALANGRH